MLTSQIHSMGGRGETSGMSLIVSQNGSREPFTNLRFLLPHPRSLSTSCSKGLQNCFSGHLGKGGERILDWNLLHHSRQARESQEESEGP